MVTIYGFHTFNNLKVLLAAEEIGVDYKLEIVNLAKQANLTPEHQARHPLSKVPAIEDGGNYLFESAAICRYLSNTHDQKLYSKEPLRAAQIDQMMDLMSQHIGRWLGKYYWEEVIRKNFMKQEPSAEVLKEAAGFLEKQLPALEARLAETEFVCGNEYTLADCIAYPYFEAQAATSFSADPYPSITRWMQTVADRPATKKAQQQLQH